MGVDGPGGSGGDATRTVDVQRSSGAMIRGGAVAATVVVKRATDAVGRLGKRGARRLKDSLEMGEGRSGEPGWLCGSRPANKWDTDASQVIHCIYVAVVYYADHPGMSTTAGSRV